MRASVIAVATLGAAGWSGGEWADAQNTNNAGAGANNGNANSTNQGDVLPVLRAFKVSVREGREQLAPATSIKPGEVIEYQVSYTNRGTREVRNLRALLPIPTQLQLVAGTTEPGNAQASLDGRTFAAMPLKRKVRMPSGEEKTVLVPLAEYRYLRWTLDELAPGKSASVKARVRLAPVSRAASSTASSAASSAASSTVGTR